jgi:hypothetical protein
MKIGRTPFTGELPIGGTATLKVRLQGFTPQKLRVSLDRDVNWSVKLRARSQR